MFLLYQRVHTGIMQIYTISGVRNLSYLLLNPHFAVKYSSPLSTCI
jgi:hypothetical protein